MKTKPYNELFDEFTKNDHLEFPCKEGFCVCHLSAIQQFHQSRLKGLLEELEEIKNKFKKLGTGNNEVKIVLETVSTIEALIKKWM